MHRVQIPMSVKFEVAHWNTLNVTTKDMNLESFVSLCIVTIFFVNLDVIHYVKLIHVMSHYCKVCNMPLWTMTLTIPLISQITLPFLTDNTHCWPIKAYILNKLGPVDSKEDYLPALYSWRCPQNLLRETHCRMKSFLRKYRIPFMD